MMLKVFLKKQPLISRILQIKKEYYFEKVPEIISLIIVEETQLFVLISVLFYD